MKLTVFFTLIIVFNSWANVMSQEVSIKGNNIKITDFFKVIKEQTGFDVVSKGGDIQAIRLELDLKNVPLELALKKVLPNQGLTYQIKNKAIVVKKDDAVINNKSSVGATNVQQSSIQGKVENDQGVALSNVNVKVQSTGVETATNANGDFQIAARSGDVLLFSYMGYQSQRFTVANTQKITITLVSTQQDLDEVVVVGFGTQRKNKLTGSVATVDPKALESRPVTSVTQALQGTVPGLNIGTSSLGGQLGESMTMNIRGAGTIGMGSSASPLVLVDGIEGNLNNINADDIASISVLKDASAASIYGSRAAFGVILVTTKAGKAGVSRISYSNNFRNSSPTNLPRLLNSYDFANYFNESAINNGGQAIFNANTLERIKDYVDGKITTSTIPNEGNGNWQFHEQANDNVDWYNVHYKSAWSSENNINFNGGSDKYRFYASANYLNQNGNLRYGDDKMSRFQGMAKMNAVVNKYVDVELITRFMRSKLDNPYYSSLGGLLYHDIVRMWPMMPFEDPNGHYMRNGKLIQLTSGSRSLTNTDNLFLQGQIAVHPLEGWNIYGNIGMRTINANNQSNVNAVNEYNVNGAPLLLQYDGGRTAGATEASQWFNNSNMYTTSLYTDYTKQFDNHSFKVMIGANTELYKYRDLGAMRADLFTESVPEIGAAGGKDKINFANVNDWATAGFFGRVNYDYANKYLVEFNLRYDGSSRFLSDQRWSWFPSVSLGWDVAKEDFMIDNAIFSMIKPRFSWGELGNQNTNSYYPFYLTQPIAANGGAWLIGGVKPTVAYVPGVISSLLTWEKVKTTNYGLDVSALRSRLNMNFDYYNRTTADMVGPAAEIGAVYGTGLPITNNAILVNKGWELVLNWKDKINEVGYTVGVNLSDNVVKVKKYPNASKSLSTYYDGQVLGEIWGYETEGIAKSGQQMADWIAVNKPSWGSNWGEGDIMYRDLNGDGEVNSGAGTLNNPGDRRVIGNSMPRYNYGLTLGADWKGFDVFAFLQGVGKKDAWLGDPLFWGVGSGQWQATGLSEHLDYYRPENTNSVFGVNTNAYYPKPYIGDGKNQQTQTKYLQNASYLRLKNIQVGYSVSEEALKRIGIYKARVYFSGENLFTITKVSKVFDPEAIGGPYGTGKTYPLSTTFSFGCNLTF